MAEHSSLEGNSYTNERDVSGIRGLAYALSDDWLRLTSDLMHAKGIELESTHDLAQCSLLVRQNDYSFIVSDEQAARSWMSEAPNKSNFKSTLLLLTEPSKAVGELKEAFSVPHVIIVPSNITQKQYKQLLDQALNRYTYAVLAETLSQQLAQLKDEIKGFNHTISHDLRAPLRAIEGFSKAVLANTDKNQLDDTSLHYLHRVNENVERMKVLIEGLLAYAKLTNRHLDITTFSCDELMRQVIEQLQPEEAGVKIVNKNLPILTADKYLMREVFMHLVQNGIKFSANQEKPVITIESSQTSNETIITFKDNGVGFDNAYSHKLFGLFQRLHDADQFDGIGQGLAMVAKIVDLHGGRYWAESKLEKGASFYIALPNLPKSKFVTR